MLNATVGQGEVKKGKANVADSMSYKDLPFPVADVTVVSMPLALSRMPRPYRIHETGGCQRKLCPGYPIESASTCCMRLMTVSLPSTMDSP